MEEKLRIEMTQIPDSEFYEYVAERLRKKFEEKCRVGFRFGVFGFVFHNGHFVGVEEKFNSRAFWVSGRRKSQS